MEEASRSVGQTPADRGTVYVFADLERGLLKIGHTYGAVEKRRRGIESASGAQLVLLGCVRGSRDDEYSMHEMFAHLRVRGEWFRVGEDALDFFTDGAFDGALTA